MTRKCLALTWMLAGLAVLAAGNLTSAQQVLQSRPVYLRVLLPEEEVELEIDGHMTKQSGTSRLFVSPPLQPGRTFTYTLTATWEPNNYTKFTRTRSVPVQAGQEIVVDLRQPDEKNPDKIVIRYVPTPQEVVEAMCKLGEVGKGDIVYDLGCGDGRLVITAIKDYGAKRGVGVDIDPERIKDSKENAAKAGAAVEGKVEFRQADVLTLKDLGDANVVMLYMGDDVNERLRPILQKTLKPGSRIVSHRFLMGDWKPDKTITVTDDNGGEYDLHLWKIGTNGAEKKD
jgi:uncharacterized protein (TIGR03000 family)